MSGEESEEVIIEVESGDDNQPSSSDKNEENDPKEESSSEVEKMKEKMVGNVFREKLETELMNCNYFLIFGKPGSEAMYIFGSNELMYPSSDHMKNEMEKDGTFNNIPDLHQEEYFVEEKDETFVVMPFNGSSSILAKTEYRYPTTYKFDLENDSSDAFKNLSNNYDISQEFIEKNGIKVFSSVEKKYHEIESYSIDLLYEIYMNKNKEVLIPYYLEEYCRSARKKGIYIGRSGDEIDTFFKSSFSVDEDDEDDEIDRFKASCWGICSQCFFLFVWCLICLIWIIAVSICYVAISSSFFRILVITNFSLLCFVVFMVPTCAIICFTPFSFKNYDKKSKRRRMLEADDPVDYTHLSSNEEEKRRNNFVLGEVIRILSVLSVSICCNFWVIAFSIAMLFSVDGNRNGMSTFLEIVLPIVFGICSCLNIVFVLLMFVVLSVSTFLACVTVPEEVGGGINKENENDDEDEEGGRSSFFKSRRDQLVVFFKSFYVVAVAIDFVPVWVFEKLKKMKKKVPEEVEDDDDDKEDKNSKNNEENDE